MAGTPSAAPIRFHGRAATAWIAALFVSLLAPDAPAAERIDACPRALQDVRLPPPPDSPPDDTVVSAESGLSRPADDGLGRIIDLNGGVLAHGHGQGLRAGHMRYRTIDRSIQADGGIVYESSDLRILGRRGRFDLAHHRGRIEDGTYAFRHQPGRGRARLARMTGRRVTVLDDSSYTTCPPGNEDWSLRFSSLTLDQGDGLGRARHARLYFMGVPILYTPYITFPIDDRRRTGFLTPNYRLSSEGGGELTVPFYIDLAPNYDLTLRPRNLTRRGFMLGGEFRYLFQNGSGRLDLEYLPDDRVFGNDRGLVEWQHLGQVGANLQVRVDYRQVSDERYLADLGNSLTSASLTHLPQRLQFLYSTPTWLIDTRIQSFQTIDPSIPKVDRPYQTLPAIRLKSHLPLRENRPNPSFGLDYANFQRTDRVSGRRLDLRPAILFPLRSSAFHLDTTLAVHHSRYSLDALAPAGRHPQRTLPQLSIDGRAFLERDVDWRGQGFVQTLEPRLFYLYTPYRDQSALPVFDAGRTDLAFSQLFRDNRFNGLDRIGDANQLTLALSSRLLERDTAREWGRIDIGQILYFTDRRVTLPGEPVETASTSAITADAFVRMPGGLNLSSDARWDTRLDKFDKGTMTLQYAPGRRRIVNLSYRYRLETLGQTDLSFVWPIVRPWRLLGRWNRSIRHGRDLETLFGIEYDSCCWRLQFLRRRYVNDGDGSVNKTWFLQLSLKGLTRLGNRIDEILEHGILGYRR